ncbi:MAG: hypothetical protein R2911_32315 [Caldilineaceae bacterium]
MKLHFYQYLISGILIVGVVLSLFSGVGFAAPTFTGDAAADFTGADVVTITDLTNDVGIPAPDFPPGSVSGWDMRAIYLEYDAATDTLYVGVDCVVICGDADNDGDPNTTGPILGKPASEGGLGGADVADWGSGESFGLIFDTNNDGAFEVVVGVKNSQDISTFGAYNFSGRTGTQLRNTGWGAALSNVVSLYAPTSADAPDLEFTIENFSTLPGFTAGDTALSYQVHAGMGSGVDDGIGEDFTTGVTGITPTPAPPTDTPTNTPVPPTSTPIPPTDTPTNTPIPPTSTPIPPTNTPVPPTSTPIPPTDTPTNTTVPPTSTPIPPTNTPTNTPQPPTSTPIPLTDTPTNTPLPPTPTIRRRHQRTRQRTQRRRPPIRRFRLLTRRRIHQPIRRRHRQIHRCRPTRRNHPRRSPPWAQI